MGGSGVARIQVIANPAAGKDEPVLAPLNAAFGQDVRWDVSVTQGSGDAEAATREAVEAGVDVVAAYGGDGTVREVASGLAGGDVPMLVLAGGTANVMAHELGIPTDLRQAASLAVGAHTIRRVDLAETADGRRFFLRAGIGWEADAVQGADRGLKDKLGEFAYVLSGMRELLRTRPASYRITVDGETAELDGFSCVVANSMSLGVGALTLDPNVKVDDGILDALLLRRGDAAGLASLANVAAGGEAGSDVLARFSGRHIRVEGTPPQSVVLDGEDAGETPLDVHVLPAAVPVIVPTATEGDSDEG